MAKKTAENKEEILNVDEALLKLEGINRQLAASDLELGKAIELYKEGVELAAKCRERLVGIETELKIIEEA